MILAHDLIGDPGAGPAVVLIHAGVADRRMWDQQWEALAQHATVLRPDIRGFGQSPLSMDPYTSAGDVLALMDHVGVSGALVVGASMGGRIALEVAATAPDRVTDLVLLCPAVPGMPRTASLDRFNEQEDSLVTAGDLDAATELNLRTWLGPEASESSQASLRLMQRHAFEIQAGVDEDGEQESPEIDLATLGTPTLVVSGGHDIDAFQTAARQLAVTLPDARHLHLGWAGHLPSLERPSEITLLLLEVLHDRG